jgi:hypothetical protein
MHCLCRVYARFIIYAAFMHFTLLHMLMQELCIIYAIFMQFLMQCNVNFILALCPIYAKIKHNLCIFAMFMHFKLFYAMFYAVFYAVFYAGEMVARSPSLEFIEVAIVGRWPRACIY